MLDLLRSGFDHGWTVSTDAEVPTAKSNGESIRVWLTKEAGSSGRGLRVS